MGMSAVVQIWVDLIENDVKGHLTFLFAIDYNSMWKCFLKRKESYLSGNTSKPTDFCPTAFPPFLPMWGNNPHPGNAATAGQNIAPNFPLLSCHQRERLKCTNLGRPAAKHRKTNEKGEKKKEKPKNPRQESKQKSINKLYTYSAYISIFLMYLRS
jgi:hypothetical protein